MSFDDINAKIVADLKRKPSESNHTPTSDIDVANMTKSKPVVTSGVYVGRPISAIGSEKVLIETTELLYIEYTRIGKRKTGCAVVEKGVYAKEPTTYINKDGYIATAIRRDVFHKTVNIINNAVKQLKEARKEIQQLKQERDTAKMLVDTLRKNGVIE